MITVYFAAADHRWSQYEAPLQAAFAQAGLEVDLSPTCQDPAGVDYVIYAPNGPLTDFTPFTRVKAVLSLWAGVEKIVTDPTLTQPLCRMVDGGLKEGMIDYVIGHTMRYHLGMDQYFGATEWTPVVPPLARDRQVTVLGMGELGQACATALVDLRFQVTGWSRRPKDVPGVTCLSGDDGLEQALHRAEILVLLLPLTAGTQDLLNAKRLGALPKGAYIINPGRGPLIVDQALLDALDSGQVAHATLDVFHTEPLPADHPYWTHPQVTVTPHIASETRASTAAQVITENVRRGETGEPFLHLVDRGAGY